MKKIADAGLLIAGLDRQDPYHAWAAGILSKEAPPWLVCEPVLAEVAASIGTCEPVLEMLQVGDLVLAFNLHENRSQLLALVRKYPDQPMDLADACVVRMSELLPDSVVYTVDRRDFSVYRRHRRRPLRCVFPP